MIGLGPLSFAVPLALAGLLALPALWWLLRAVPPRPRQVRFPPLRVLLGLSSPDHSVERTPPWLLALRLVAVLCLVLGAAHPLWNAGGPLPGTGPIVLVVDDGWAAGADWPSRQRMMAELTGRAEREGRRVVLVSTAPAPGRSDPPPPRLMDASEARDRITQLAPKPWETRRDAAVEALRGFPGLAAAPPAAIYWLSDGLGQAEGRSVGALAQTLRPLGSIEVRVPEPSASATIVRPPEVAGDTLHVIVQQASPVAAEPIIHAIGEDGRIVGHALARPITGERTAQAALTLPAELRNRLARIELASSDRTAGSVVLLDHRWQRRPVGIAAPRAVGGEVPLLSEIHYLERALEGEREVRRGEVADLLGRELAALVLTDESPVDGDVRQRIERWVTEGGILVRFAGPRLAAAGGRDDALLPVPLRPGDRVLGGALAWREPAKFAPFPTWSPFVGLELPADVEVYRQVLAEPGMNGQAQTWAELDDGTPLVTARGQGDGWLVLFHVSAGPDGSSLPLSGLFMQMLERIVGLGRGVSEVRTDAPPLAPIRVLDGFGNLGPAPSTARPIPAEVFGQNVAGPLHPPGLYGSEGHVRALNLSETLPHPEPIGPMPGGISVAGYGPTPEIDFRPWLLGLALALVLIDLAASLALRGLLPRGMIARPRRIAGAMVAAALTLATVPAWAQQVVADGSAMPQTLVTSLAYLRTGNAELDAVSRVGLRGLSLVVNRRTAVELADPVGVDPATDELAFFPLVYWPAGPTAPMPSEAAMRNLRAYMAGGGTVVIDTGAAGGGAGQGLDLRQLAQALDLPPLVPVYEDHVLGRAYYLLARFPGRFADGTVWVERTGEHVHDGVSRIIAGSNDWASAWALDDELRPLFPVIPGGERQRELAYRFGINLVMYVLTGSYKSDQVHLPAIMERLRR